MNGYSPIRQTPPVVKNLIIINLLMLFATYVLEHSAGINVTHLLGMHYFKSEHFRIHQLITHMFMHGGLTHLFFNMFALWMFGRILEGVWGSKRFLFYYFFTGIGAVILHSFVSWIEFSSMENALNAYANTPSADGFVAFINEHFSQFKSAIHNDTAYQQILNNWKNQPGNNAIAQNSVSYLRSVIEQLYNIPVVGASGAVFGILLGFGMLFPNTQLMLLFPPIPIRAKYFVIMYGILELYLGLSHAGSNIAHFAHLGGMVFGFILIKYWNYSRHDFY